MLNPEKERTFTCQGRRVVVVQEANWLPEALRAVGLPEAPRAEVLQAAAAALQGPVLPVLRRVVRRAEEAERLARAAALRVAQWYLFPAPHKRCDRSAEPDAVGAG